MPALVTAPPSRYACSRSGEGEADTPSPLPLPPDPSPSWDHRARPLCDDMMTTATTTTTDREGEVERDRNMHADNHRGGRGDKDTNRLSDRHLAKTSNGWEREETGREVRAKASAPLPQPTTPSKMHKEEPTRAAMQVTGWEQANVYRSRPSGSSSTKRPLAVVAGGGRGGDDKQKSPKTLFKGGEARENGSGTMKIKKKRRRKQDKARGAEELPAKVRRLNEDDTPMGSADAKHGRKEASLDKRQDQQHRRRITKKGATRADKPKKATVVKGKADADTNAKAVKDDKPEDRAEELPAGGVEVAADGNGRTWGEENQVACGKGETEDEDDEEAEFEWDGGEKSMKVAEKENLESSGCNKQGQGGIIMMNGKEEARGRPNTDDEEEDEESQAERRETNRKNQPKRKLSITASAKASHGAKRSKIANDSKARLPKGNAGREEIARKNTRQQESRAVRKEPRKDTLKLADQRKEEGSRAARRRALKRNIKKKAATGKADAFLKILRAAPTSRRRKVFLLPKSLVPLGVWPPDNLNEFDIPDGWKISAQKRNEVPPRYRKLKANLYSDKSYRGRVPIDEIPLCHCNMKTGCDINCLNRQLLMECAPGRCPTLSGEFKHCRNNAIQTKSFPSTEVFRTLEGRGWGLRLSDEAGVEEGTLLHEYLGEVINMDECRERLRLVGRNGGEASSSDFYFASLDGNLVLDAGPMGSEARFANHSCAPNCVLQKWSVMGETRVVLVAAKDITFHEELTYNYQADTLGGFVERQKCLCGEPQCSGFIGGELVTLKADDWRRRTTKVMSQSKPQLDVVRRLFAEGQELGYVEQDEDGSTRYFGREMECLSTLLMEGDAWLTELAMVMGEQRNSDEPCSRQRPQAHLSAEAVVAPRVVNLHALEDVLDHAPSGLHVAQAVKARKMATRADLVAKTVRALLDAASDYGVDVTAQDQQVSSSARRSSSGKTARLKESCCNPVGSKESCGAEAALPLDDDRAVSGTDGAPSRRRSDHGMEQETGGKEPSRDENGECDRPGESGGHMSCLQQASSSAQRSHIRKRRRSRNGVQKPADVDTNVHADINADINADVADDDVPLMSTISTAIVGESVPNAAGAASKSCVTTRSARTKKNVDTSTASTPTEGRKQTVVLPSTLADFSRDDLPPKPSVTQVYQALKRCKGVAPVLIPGASELVKLVTPAEAWATEACQVLKIQTVEPTSDGGDNQSAAERSWTSGKSVKTDEMGSLPDKGGAPKHAPNDPKKRVEGTVNGCRERGQNKWENVGLKCFALVALEDKLQDVAEFSLARDEREEEVEKQRLRQEKEILKEQNRQNRLARVANLSSRRRERSDHGAGSQEGEYGTSTRDKKRWTVSADDGSSMYDVRRSQRCSVSDGSSTAEGSRFVDGKRAAECVQKRPRDRKSGKRGVPGEWKKEDDHALHCFCRLPADTARFRTLMTCDLCHDWFHPACVRLKELREDDQTSQGLAFICPVCEHAKGSVSNFACPPSPGFYISRRMHRPAQSELEQLIEHADRLPVDAGDGQAYLSYMLRQVARWRERCSTAVQDVEDYIRCGELNSGEEEVSRRPRPQGNLSATFVARPETAEQNTVEGGEVAGACHRGLLLPSGGRDLELEAGLIEKLGRLVCEGALIEVVDIHKEDIMVRRMLWALTASLSFPSTVSSLRVGQAAGIQDTLSPPDEESLRSSGGSRVNTIRLRPTLETLEASLTEGRTLGLSKIKSRAFSKIRSSSSPHEHVTPVELAVPSSSKKPPHSTSEECKPDAGPLGAGARVYAQLFSDVGAVIHAVVHAEARSFVEARASLPGLEATTHWVAIESTWGYARASASELCWQRRKATSVSEREGKVSAGATARARMELEAERLRLDGAKRELGATRSATSALANAWKPDAGVYCVCRSGDDGGVMVSCDACSEWFHASCVGLNARRAEGLQEYHCLVCCGEQPETYGSYKHRWVTNVAVEAAVRRMTSKRKGKTDVASPVPKHNNDMNTNHTITADDRCVTYETHQCGENLSEGGDKAATGGQFGPNMYRKRRRMMSTRLAEVVADAKGGAHTIPGPVTSCLERYQGKVHMERHACWRSKRERALIFVTTYVEQCYKRLGLPWPLEKPIPSFVEEPDLVGADAVDGEC